MEGANPCKKDAGGLREPTKTLQKFIPWHQKSKSSRKLPPDHGAIAEDCKDVSADKTSVVSAAKTSVVSADKTSVVSADISQDIPQAFSRQGRPLRGRPCVYNAQGMSWQTADLLSADTTDVLAADTTDVLAADTTDVLSADTSLQSGNHAPALGLPRSPRAPRSDCCGSPRPALQSLEPPAPCAYSSQAPRAPRHYCAVAR